MGQDLLRPASIESADVQRPSFSYDEGGPTYSGRSSSSLSHTFGVCREEGVRHPIS